MPKAGRRRASTSSDGSSDEEAVSFKRVKKDTDGDGKPKPIVFSAENNGSYNKSKGKAAPAVNGHGASKVMINKVERKNGISRSLVNYDQDLDTSIFNRPRRLASEAPAQNGTLEKKETDPTAAEIMSQMGFEKGKGLAKFINVDSKNKVPFSLELFEKKMEELGISKSDDAKSDNNQDIVVEEEVNWIPPEAPRLIDLDELITWRKIGPIDTTVKDSTEFVDLSIVQEVISCKKLYQDMDEKRYQSVRTRSNLFEKIGKGPFICRAAMKLANLDSMLGFALSDPKSETGNPVVGPHELFYFSDVCAGPGGFSEYILWRKKWEAKGFGFTLKGDLDFKTGDFVAGAESFEPFYGPAGDGNVYKPDNASAFIHHVLTSTDGKGVHLMTADGGFSVSKQEYMQEVLSGHIVLSQVMIALGIVKQGGHFVCKLFDVLTPFTVGLMYLLYLSFGLISIHKPNASRPANSERYVICKWKREGTDAIFRYLLDCHRLLWTFSQDTEETKSIIEVVPMAILKNDKHPFYKYLLESNNSIGLKQILSLKNMISYVIDPKLENSKQKDAKVKSMELWNIPEEIISRPLTTSDSLCKDILGIYPLTMLRHSEKSLTSEKLDVFFKSPYDWRFVVVEAQETDKNRGFYLSLGHRSVYRYDGHSWIGTFKKDNRIELSYQTLVYGEIVEEVHGKKPTQKVMNVFHIIDGLMLGGKDIRSLHYTQRHECCVKFAKSMNKSIPGVLPVRVKNPVRMENVADLTDRLEHRVIKGQGIGVKLVCPIDHTDENSPVIQPSGLLFIKITRDPWQMALNRSANRKYWFNKVTGKASNAVPEDAISCFFWTMSNRVIWWWDKDTNVILSTMDASDPRMNVLNPAKVHTFSLLNHIHASLRMSPQLLAQETQG